MIVSGGVNIYFLLPVYEHMIWTYPHTTRALTSTQSIPIHPISHMDTKIIALLFGGLPFI